MAALCLLQYITFNVVKHQTRNNWPHWPSFTLLEQIERNTSIQKETQTCNGKWEEFKKKKKKVKKTSISKSRERFIALYNKGSMPVRADHQ